MRVPWLIAAAGLALVAPLLATVRGRPVPMASIALASPPPQAAKASLAATPDAGRAPEPEVSPLAGLDVLHLHADDAAVVAPTGAGTATLTLDADLQRSAQALMHHYRFPQASVVLLDVATGRLLVYASHVEEGPARDLCAEATAPSASVFKIVTAAALLENAHLTADTKQCYSGGEQRIVAANLVDDPRRDRWCTTLAGAFGRSINTVFARLSAERLEPDQLEAMAHRFGYGEPFPFDLSVETSSIKVPAEKLEFARTAAGFWNSTLSPLEAAELSATVARGGEAIQPSLVEQVSSSAGAVLWTAPKTPPVHRVVTPEIAAQLAEMMTRTVAEGTSYRAFHDGRGSPFLPNLTVGGKTGTLTDTAGKHLYTWFTGFAPLHPTPEAGQVAIATLVVNGPEWQAKANVLAREVLREYFAGKNVAGVTAPSTSRVARRRSH